MGQISLSVANIQFRCSRNNSGGRGVIKWRGLEGTKKGGEEDSVTAKRRRFHDDSRAGGESRVAVLDRPRALASDASQAEPGSIARCLSSAYISFCHTNSVCRPPYPADCSVIKALRPMIFFSTYCLVDLVCRTRCRRIQELSQWQP